MTPDRKISRRQFLGLSLEVGAASAVAACSRPSNNESKPTALAPENVHYMDLDMQLAGVALAPLAGAKFPNSELKAATVSEMQVIVENNDNKKPLILDPLGNDGKPNQDKQYAFAIVPVVQASGENAGKSAGNTLAMIGYDRLSPADPKGVILNARAAGPAGDGTSVVHIFDALEAVSGELKANGDTVTLSVTYEKDNKASTKIVNSTISVYDNKTQKSFELVDPSSGGVTPSPTKVPDRIVNQLVSYTFVRPTAAPAPAETPPPKELTEGEAREVLFKEGFNRHATDVLLTNADLKAAYGDNSAALQKELGQRALQYASKMGGEVKKLIVPQYVDTNVLKNGLKVVSGGKSTLEVQEYTNSEMNTWGDGSSTILMAVHKGKGNVLAPTLWRDAHLVVQEGKASLDVVGTMMSIQPGSDGKESLQPVAGQNENGANAGITVVENYKEPILVRRVGLSKNSVDAVAEAKGWSVNPNNKLEGRVEVSEELQLRVKDAIPSNLGYFVSGWTADEAGRPVVEVRARIVSEEKVKQGDQGKLRGIPIMVGNDLMLIGVSDGMSDFVDAKTHVGGYDQSQAFIVNPAKDPNNTKHLQQIMSNLHCAMDIIRRKKEFNSPEEYAGYVDAFYQQHRDGKYDEKINYTSMTVGPIEMDQFTGLPWSKVGKYSINGDNQFAYHETNEKGEVNLYNGTYYQVSLDTSVNAFGIQTITDQYLIDGSNRFYMLTPELKNSLASEGIAPPGPMDKIAIIDVLEGVEAGVGISLHDIGLTKENVSGSDFRFNSVHDPYFTKTILKDFGGVNLPMYATNGGAMFKEANGFIFEWLYGNGAKQPLKIDQEETVRSFISRLNNIPNLTPFETEIVSLK